MKIFKTFLIFLFNCVLCCNSQLHSIEKESASAFSYAISALLNLINFENDKTITIVKTYSANNYDSTYELDDLITKISVNALNSTVQILDYEMIVKTSKNIEDRLKNPKKFNVILLEKFEDFQPIIDFYESKFFDFRGYTIITFLQKSNSRFDDASRMFRALWKKHIVNTNILVEGKGEHEIDVLTGFPFQTAKCNDIVMKKINTIVNGKFRYNKSFTFDKFSRMNQCPIIIDHKTVKDSFGSAFMFNDSKTRQFDGIDVKILEREFEIQIKACLCFKSVF